MEHPLSVCHVVLSLDCGGLERVVLSLIAEGRKLGQRIAVACVERPGALADEAERLGARLVSLDKGAGMKLSVVGRLARLFRELQADVVHTHQAGALFYAGPAAWRAGVPATVHTEHGKHYAAARAKRWLARAGGLFASRFFCVSRDIADAVRACRVVPARKLHVVPNGIDVDRYEEGDLAAPREQLGIPSGVPVVGTVGRLNEVKRQDFLLRAFVQVRSRLPEARLVLVGDGPLRESLQELADKLGLRECVHFAGYQPAPERFLRLMDVFALSSRTEGMPLAVLEAWAAGLPVVAPAVGGLPELIEQGRTGLLSRPDDEAGLADALCELLRDPARARRIGAAGRQEVRSRFTLGHMARTYEQHYRELCNGRQTAGVPCCGRVS